MGMLNEYLLLSLILLVAPVVIRGIVMDSRLERQYRLADQRRTAEAGSQPHTRQFRGGAR